MVLEDSTFYKRVLDSMRDMVLVKGPESRLLWANKSFRDYYGMTEEELKGIVDGEQSNSDNTLQYMRDDKFVFDTEKDLNIPSEPVTNSGGDTSYFHTVKSPIFDNATMVELVGVSRLIEDQDIQEQDLTELDAKVFTAPLRSIIDSYPMATMLLDHDLRIIKCNTRWCNLFGDAPSMSNIDFDKHFEQLVDLEKIAKESLENKGEVESVIRIETSGLPNYFDFKVTPWKYPNDTIGGLIVLATDVTSIKQNEENLLETQRRQEVLNRRLMLALKASNVGVWEWDLTTNSLIWDKQMYNLYATKEEDFDGAYSAWEKGLHPDDKARSVAEIENATSGASKFDTEFRVVWPTGEVRSIRALADLMLGKDGSPVKMIGVNWDITDAKRFESKLQKANRDLSNVNEELTEFSYRTSHDLKAPLTTSKKLAEFILMDIEIGDLDEAKQNIKKVHQQMIRLEELVTDILSLAKADFGEAENRSVNFEEIIHTIAEKLSWMDEEDTFSINSEIHTVSDFMGDRIRLSQVLENLVSNAIKYRDVQKPEQTVDIIVSEQTAGIGITVKDNGIGIPDGYQGDLFKMFKRFHPKVASGSGLGLSIVKKNVDRMGGTIEVSSSSEGTKFFISIPNGAVND